MYWLAIRPGFYHLFHGWKVKWHWNNFVWSGHSHLAQPSSLFFIVNLRQKMPSWAQYWWTSLTFQESKRYQGVSLHNWHLIGSIPFSEFKWGISWLHTFQLAFWNLHTCLRTCMFVGGKKHMCFSLRKKNVSPKEWGFMDQHRMVGELLANSDHFHKLSVFTNV